MLQHPHPIPIYQEPYEEDDSPSFYDTAGDFEPLTESGRTIEQLDGGLDLLITDQGLPGGTPGGKKADLQNGRLIDGAKHEKGGECLGRECDIVLTCLGHSCSVLLARYIWQINNALSLSIPYSFSDPSGLRSKYVQTGQTFLITVRSQALSKCY
jgi:hypothetical protein